VETLDNTSLASNVLSFDHNYTTEPQSVEEQLNAAKERIIDLEQKLSESMKISRFGLERFSSNPSMIKFYTGFAIMLHNLSTGY